jgi:DNA-binding response OmpR family regulator
LFEEGIVMNPTASVMIVDDEPSIRLMFRTTLESAGYRMREAGNGRAALEQLKDLSPDVMLLDLKMPEMDGMETLQRLRDAGHDTAVVIVTAHGSIPDAVAAMKLGAVDFLTKPVTPDVLRRVVGEIVARHRRTEPETDRGHGPTPHHQRDRGRAGEKPTDLQIAGAERLAHSPTVVVELAPPAIDLAPVKRALNQRNFLEAERRLQEVLDQTPDFPEALTLMGVLHECLGQSHAAYHSYRAAIQCAPSYAPALDNLKRYCERYGLDFHSKAINPSA